MLSLSNGVHEALLQFSSYFGLMSKIFGTRWKQDCSLWGMTSVVLFPKLWVTGDRCNPHPCAKHRCKVNEVPDLCKWFRQNSQIVCFPSGSLLQCIVIVETFSVNLDGSFSPGGTWLLTAANSLVEHIENENICDSHNPWTRWKGRVPWALGSSLL